MAVGTCGKGFLIVNNAEPGIRKYLDPLIGILRREKRSCEAVEYRNLRDANIGDYRGILLSGSPRGNDIVDHHQPYFQWIREVNIPVLGICAGHHIIGRLFGARLIRDVEREVGDVPVTIDCPDELFKGIPSPFIARQNHHDSITLPREFIRLAHSDSCRVQALKHKRLPLYGTQFHPEILNPSILMNFVRLTEDARPDTG